jgi:betaine lipid synthase
VKVVCQDARTFRLEDHEIGSGEVVGFSRSSNSLEFPAPRGNVGGADLITLSYSLSMIVSSFAAILGYLLTALAGLLFCHRFSFGASC